jgi:hypothetical protein
LVISNNTAAKGGGVGIRAGIFTMKGGTIRENEAIGAVGGSRGGGVYIAGGSFFLEDGNNYSNYADTYGGGVCLIHGDGDPRAVFMKSGGTINGNAGSSPNTAGTSSSAAVYIYAPHKQKETAVSQTDIIQYDSDKPEANRYDGTNPSL